MKKLQWSPRLEVSNSLSVEKVFESPLMDDFVVGRVKVALRLRCQCHTRMELRAFPYDRQILAVTFSSTEYAAEALELVAHPLSGGSAGLELIEWDIIGIHPAQRLNHVEIAETVSTSPPSTIYLPSDCVCDLSTTATSLPK